MGNREIKFRAWDKGHNKMSYKVNLYSINKSGVINKVQIDEKQIMNSVGFDCEIMQFTGLKDKTGKDVYEGDILNWDYCGKTEYAEWMKEPIYTVVYEDGYRLCATGIHKDLYLHAYRFKHTKILGNIYSNPELLKGRIV